MVAEKEKPENENKSLINQISKTIADNATALFFISMAPPMLNKIYDLVTIKYNSEKDKASEEIERINKLASQNVESSFYLKLNKVTPSLYYEESQSILKDKEIKELEIKGQHNI